MYVETPVDNPIKQSRESGFASEAITSAASFLERRELDRRDEQLPEQLPPLRNLPSQQPSPILQQPARLAFRGGPIDTGRRSVLERIVERSDELLAPRLSVLQPSHERRQGGSTHRDRIGQPGDLDVHRLELLLGTRAFSAIAAIALLELADPGHHVVH